MPDATVSMNVRRGGDGIAVIDIKGEITAFSQEVLTEAHNEASLASPRVVVLNFEGLEYMNSSGIGLLVTTLIRAKRQNQQLVAFGLSDHYRQIFSVTRLDEAIEIHDSEAAAVAAS